MRELSVSTQTTPVELANLFNSLLADDEVGGRRGADGAVVLYGCGNAPLPFDLARGRAVIAARVAIDVVLQHVAGMPGARPLLANVREQLAGNAMPRVGCLAPPLTMLARLYIRTTSAMPGAVGDTRLLHASGGFDDHDTDAEPAGVTAEQQQALESLIDRLMALSSPSRQPDRR